MTYFLIKTETEFMLCNKKQILKKEFRVKEMEDCKSIREAMQKIGKVNVILSSKDKLNRVRNYDRTMAQIFDKCIHTNIDIVKCKRGNQLEINFIA